MKPEGIAVLGLSTREFAALHKVNPQSIRNRLYLCGDYFGAVPCRMRNGRLVWPLTNVTTNQDAKEQANDR